MKTQKLADLTRIEKRLEEIREEKEQLLQAELLPVKRTVKKYKFSLVDSHCSVGLFLCGHIHIVFFYWCQNAKAALNTFIVVVSNIGFNCMY